MLKTESARLMTEEELNQTLKEKCANCTVDKLFFIETRSEKGTGLFPCYIQDLKKPGEDGAYYHVIVVQCRANLYDTAMVRMQVSMLNRSYRIWDRPPTKALREETAWEPMPEVQTEKGEKKAE